VDRLPRPLTSLIGRDVESDSVISLVTDAGVQLVTLTGPGGIGKTRLAIQVARQAADRFRDGVVFVALANVRDPKLMPNAIAHALGIHDAIGKVLVERIRDAHHDTKLLLVIDNLEHLIEATPVLPEILAQCPGITMLATSRRRLQVSGEHVFDVPPLDLDHAITLFEERARAIAPGFTPTSESRDNIASVCEHLELAAARIPILPPSAMRQWGDSRLELLNEGMRDAPDRHRGIREAIAWSYDLLGESEQALFRRLAVFEGGFTLDGAAAVTGHGQAVLNGISALEAGSLLKVMPGWAGKSRYFMLETIREFALERLREAGEEQTVRQLHADYVVRLTDGTDYAWWLSGGLDKLDELEPEMPNIRAALAWLQQSGDVPALLRLAGSLAPMWATRGYSREGQAWLKWGLPRSDGTPTESLTVALRALSWILHLVGDSYRSLVIAQQAHTLAEAAGDVRNFVISRMASGIAAIQIGRLDLSLQWFTTTLDDLDRCADEAWAPVTRFVTLNLLAGRSIELGEIDQAEAWYFEMTALQQALNLRIIPAGYLPKGLGDVARARGEPEQALRHYLVSMRIAREVRDGRQIAAVLGAMAGALAARGHYEAAGRLFGASEVHHERIAFPFLTPAFAIQRALGLPEHWSSMYPDCDAAEDLRCTLVQRTAPLRAVVLDSDLARTWWEEGRGLDLDAALELVDALPPAPTPSEERPGGLSPREVEVLQLLAQHHSNREIAALLFISPRTVENHVVGVYTKLNLSSRSAATAWAIRHGLA
jgi:predicted ATPase/DNA-binding CsgD family transcriptional regulator